MATGKDKTPVSRLQEYLVSQQRIPHYELIQNGVGTHNPVFTYRVQVGALWEEGSGRSKREAKHRTAEKMLKSLKIIDLEVTQGENSTESHLEPTENYVGQLKELCIIKCYPEPKYYVEEAAGPPHNRIFKMICCVSQLQDYGISSTKKQAKHQAARKMLDRLKEFMVDGIPVKPEIKEVQLPEVVVDREEIMEKYNTLKPSTPLLGNKDPAVYYKDHHKAYTSFSKTSPILSELVSGQREITVQESFSVINDIAKELEVTLSTLEISTAQRNKNCIIVTLSVFPSIAAIGKNKEKAAFNLLNSLLFLCTD